MRASLERMRCPFCVRWRMDRRGAEKWRKREWGEQERKKNNKEERERGETFQAVFSIQRHFDRAEPTLWQGVEPFWSLLPAAWGKQGARIDISRAAWVFFFPFSHHTFFSVFDSQLRIAEQVSSYFLPKQWDSAHKHSDAVHKQINTPADQTGRQTDTHITAHTLTHIHINIAVALKK